jgi:hypothetical protein
MEAERQTRTLTLLEDLGLAYVSVDEPQGFPSAATRRRSTGCCDAMSPRRRSAAGEPYSLIRKHRAGTALWISLPHGGARVIAEILPIGTGRAAVSQAGSPRNRRSRA